MPVLTDARVEQVAPGKYVFNWQPNAEAKVNIALIDADNTLIPIGSSDTSGFEAIIEAKPGQQFFKLTCGKHATIIAERRFLLDGAPNMRDFGGYPSCHGGHVKWGMLYRSGRLSALSERDKAFIHTLNLGAVFDFRREKEIQHDPTDLGSATSVPLYALPISPGNHIGFLALLAEGNLTEETAEHAMMAIFEDLAFNQAEAYLPVFEHLQTSDSPLLIHCSAGKDRTGVMAALILYLLGVSRQTILDDYLLTARYYPTPDEYEHIRTTFDANITESAMQPLMTVRPNYLAAMFTLIDERFGCKSDFFENVFGLSPSQQKIIINNCLKF